MLLVAEMPITQMRSEWAQRTTNSAPDARGKSVIKVVIDDDLSPRKMKRDSKLLTVGAVSDRVRDVPATLDDLCLAGAGSCSIR